MKEIMKYKHAKDFFKKLKKTWDTDPKELIRDALEAGFEGDYEESLEYLENGIELFGGKWQETEFKPQFWSLKATALLKLEKYDEALDAINKAIEFDKKDPFLWSKKEEILHDLEKYDESLDALNNVIKFAPELKEDSFPIKAHTLGHLEKYEEALELYTKYLKKDPSDLESWSGKSEALQDLGKMNESMQACEKGLKIDSTDFDLLSQKASLLFDMKRYEEALSIYENTTLMESSDDYEWYNKACVLSLQNKKEEALDALTVAIGLDSDNIKQMKEDKDLENIKNTERFIRLTNQEI